MRSYFPLQKRTQYVTSSNVRHARKARSFLFKVFEAILLLSLLFYFQFLQLFLLERLPKPLPFCFTIFLLFVIFSALAIALCVSSDGNKNIKFYLLTSAVKFSATEQLAAMSELCLLIIKNFSGWVVQGQ